MKDSVVPSAQKGLIISLILIAFAVVVTILKQEGNKSLGFLPMLILLGGITWSGYYYAKQMNGNVTFGNVFSHGFKTTALVAAVMGLWVAVSLTLIFPESLDRAMELQRAAMEKQGDISDEDLEKYITVGKKMAVPMGTIFSVIIYLIVGAIGALIGASIAKKNPNPFVNEHNPFNADNQ